MRKLSIYLLSVFMFMSSLTTPIHAYTAEGSDVPAEEPSEVQPTEEELDPIVTAEDGEEPPVSQETVIEQEEEAEQISAEPEGETQEEPSVEEPEYLYHYAIEDKDADPDEEGNFPSKYDIFLYGEEDIFLPETELSAEEIEKIEDIDVSGAVEGKDLQPVFGFDISLGTLPLEEGQEEPEKIEPLGEVEVAIVSEAFPDEIEDLLLLHRKEEKEISEDEDLQKDSTEEEQHFCYEELEFEYDEENNEVRFKTDSFSPFVFVKEIEKAEAAETKSDETETVPAEEPAPEIEAIKEKTIKAAGGPLRAPTSNTTDVFGILYSDGDLVFQLGNETDDSKGDVLETYTGFDGTSDHPWTSDSRVNRIIYTTDVTTTSLYSYFYSLPNLYEIQGLEHLKTDGVTSAVYCFYSCYSLQDLDLSVLDLSEVTTMESAFRYCYSLKSVNLQGSGLGETERVSFYYTFGYNRALSRIDLSGMKISSIYYAFAYSSKLITVDLSNTDISGTMSGSFYNDSKLEEIITTGASLRPSSYLDSTFSGTSRLARLDLSGMTVPSVSSSNTFNNSGITYITLGPGWRFNSAGMKLPAGNWERVSTGDVYTADELYSAWNSSMADSYSKVNVVRFDGNTGNASKKKAVCAFGEPLEELPTATKDGYTFLGWFTEPNGGTQLNEGDPIERGTYYAHWQENTYTLILKRNVEDDPDDTEIRVELPYTQIYNLSDSIFENDDKILQGWMTAAEATEAKYGPNEAVVMLAAEPNAAVTLYAKWGRTHNATVEFDEQGGRDVENIIIEKGSVLDAKQYPVPTRTGYSFMGWYTQPEGAGTRYDSSNMTINGDTMLYAFWRKDPVISFEPNGGWVETFTRVVPYNTSLGVLPRADARPEKLVGYFTSPNPGEGSKLTASQKFTEDATYYAHWGYQPYFNTNGGEVVGSFNLNTVYPVDYPAEQVISRLPTVSRDGYVLDHWELSDGTVVNAGDTVNLHDYPEIVAIWEREGAVTVTFDLDGGTLSSGQTTTFDLKEGDPLTYYPTPTKNLGGRRAEFLGWFDENDTLVTPDTVIDRDMTLTAKYAEKGYKLTFDPQGGADVASYNSSGTNARYLSAGEPLGIVPGSKRDGYYLDGWYSQPDGQGTKLAEDTVVTENTTWYANWIPNRTDKISDDVAYKFWAEWTNASNDNVDNIDNNLNFHPTSQTNQTASLHVHFELNSQVASVLPTGSVRIRVPKYIWKDWDGQNTGTNNLSAQMPAFPKTSSGMWFSFIEDGDDYVMVNNQPLAGGTGVDLTISYQVAPMDVPGGAIDSNGDYVDGYPYYQGDVPVNFYIDKQFDLNGQDIATAPYDPETEEQVDLTCEMHTKVPSTINKKYRTTLYDWNSNWGTKPLDADDYFYIEWETQAYIGAASQPSSYSLNEYTVHDGTIVYQEATTGGVSKRYSNYFYLNTVTKHPKSLLDNMPAAGIDFLNQSQFTVTTKSGYQTTIAAEATHKMTEWKYTVGEFDKTNTYGGVHTITGGQETVLDDKPIEMSWELHYDGVSRDTPIIWNEESHSYDADTRVISIADGVNGDLFYSSGDAYSKYVWEPTTRNYTLSDDDYRIKTLRIITREYHGTYHNSEWGGPMRSNDPENWKDIDIYLRYKNTDELIFWKSVRPTNNSNGVSVTLPDGVNGYEIRYPTKYFRTFLQTYMTIDLYPTAEIKSRVYNDTMLEVVSVIKNRGYCNIWTDDTGVEEPDTPEIKYQTKTWTGHNVSDEIFFHVTDWTGGSNGANKECYELNKSSVSLYTQKNSSSQGNVIFDVERGYQENPMAIAGWTYASSGTVKYIKNGTFYDLLPKGATVPEESIFGVLSVYNSTNRDTNYADQYAAQSTSANKLAREFYNVQFIENWEDSGRTMMVIRFMVPENRKYNRAIFYYKLKMTYADIVNYGTTVENDVAFIDDSVRDYEYSSSQNPSTVITEREFYDMINYQNDWVAHGAADTNYIPVDAFSWGFDKSVMTKTEYVHEDVTIPNNLYTYKLNFSQSDYATSDSITFFDVLETGAYNNEGQLETPSEWFGYFENIDVSSIRTKVKYGTSDVYCDPVVYYSTKPRDQFTGADYVVSNTATWTTEMPADKTTITAVAVDCTKATDGSTFVQQGRTSMAVYITMRAPIDSQYIGMSAVNQAHLISRVYENEPPENPTDVTSDTTITLEDEEPEIHKTSDPESGTQAEPTVIGYGDDITYTITVQNKNETFTVENYIVEDTIPEGVQVKENEVKVHFGNPENAASVSVSPRVDMKIKDGKMTFTINSLLAGEKAYIIIPTRATARGDDDPIHNQAILRSANGIEKDILSEETWHEVQYDVIFSKQSDLKQLVVGAQLELYDTDTDQLIESWTTTKANKKIRLYIGNFKLVETYAPDGYALADDILFSVQPDGTILYESGATDTKVTMVDVASTTVTGTKTWKWDDVSDRPASITVNLLRNGLPYRSQTVTAANGWKYDFGQVPKYDEHKAPYVYTISEDPVTGYIAAYSSGKKTNAVELIFNPRTSMADTGDYFEIFYVYQGKMFKAGHYTSTDDFSDLRVTLPTTDFCIYWHSNTSGNDYGFRIDQIKPVESTERIGARANLPTGVPIEEVTGNKYPETDHNYFISEDILWHYTAQMEGDVLDVVNTKETQALDIPIEKVGENNEQVSGVTLRVTGTPAIGDYTIEPIEWVTDGTPKVLRLQPGSYVLHEVSAVAGYQFADDIPFRVNQNGEVLWGDDLTAVILEEVQNRIAAMTGGQQSTAARDAAVWTNKVTMLDKYVIQPYPFSKVWMDAGYEDDRPESVEFKLYRRSTDGTDDTLIDTVTLTASDAASETVWEGQFDDVPVVDENWQPYSYYVTETVNGNDYRVFYDVQNRAGFMVKFTDDSDIGSSRLYVDLFPTNNVGHVDGLWSDRRLILNPVYSMEYLEGTDMAGKSFFIPSGSTFKDTFGFTLEKADDFVKLEIEEIIPVTEAPAYETVPHDGGHWSDPATFTGKDYPTFETEPGVNSYSAVYHWVTTEEADRTIDRPQIINYPNKTKVYVTKQWDDSSNANSTRPSSITFDIFNERDMTTPVDTKTFDVDMSTDEKVYFFDDLPKYNSDDLSEAVYIVRERAVENYHADYLPAHPKGFLVKFTNDSTVGQGNNMYIYMVSEGHRSSNAALLYDIEGGSHASNVVGNGMAGKTYYVPVVDENDPSFAILVDTRSPNQYDVNLKVESITPVDYRHFHDCYSAGPSLDGLQGTTFTGADMPIIQKEAGSGSSSYALYRYEYKNTLVNRYDVTSVPFEKHWENENGFLEYRPASLAFNVYNVKDLNTVVATKTLTSSNLKPGTTDVWTGSFEGLPKYNDDGTEAMYIVKDASVPAGYEQKPSKQDIKGFILKFSDDTATDYSSIYIHQSDGEHMINRIEAGYSTGYWSYGSGYPLSGQTVYVPVLVPGVNEFYIEAYRNTTQPIKIDIEEIYPVYEEYHHRIHTIAASTPNVNEVVTNASSYSHTLQTNESASFILKYVYDVDDDFDGVTNTLKKWPVTINKYSNAWPNLPGATLQIIKASDGTTVVDEWLTQYFQNHTVYLPEGDYVLHEKSPAPGFASAADMPFTVEANGTIRQNGASTALLRMYDQEYTEVKGQKIWQGDSLLNRPSSITVNLYRNGTKIDSQTITASDNWEYSFENLPKYNGTGTLKYTYTTDEEAVHDYQVVYGSASESTSWVDENVPGTPGLKVTLNSTARTESTNFDYFYIYYVDPATGQTRYFTTKKGGTNIANASYYIPGREFWFLWRTDGSVQYYGWDVVNVEPVIISSLETNAVASSTWSSGYTLKEYSGTNYPQTNHTYTNSGRTQCYGNNERINYHYTYLGELPSGGTPIEEITDKHSSSITKNLTNIRLPDKINVSIQKKTSEGTLIPGAVLEITGHETNAVYDIDPIRFTTTAEPTTVQLRQGTYTMTEITVPSGYLRADPVQFSINAQNKVVIDGVVQETNTVPMIDAPNLRDFPFTKTWDDAGHEQYRPASVKFTLYNERDMETPVKEVTLTSANASDASTWNGIFTDVPIVNEDDESPAVYKIVEQPVPYYTPTYYGVDSTATQAIPQMTRIPTYGIKVTMASSCYTNGPLLLVWKDRMNGFWYGANYGVSSNSIINLNASELYMLYRSYGYRAGILVDSAVPLGTAENPYPTSLTFSSSYIATSITDPYAAIQHLIDRCNDRSYFPVDAFTLDDFVLGNDGYHESVENEDYNDHPVYQLVKLTVPTTAEPVVSPGMTAEEIENAEGFKLTFADDMFTGSSGPIFIVWKDESTGKYVYRASNYYNARDEIYIKSHEFYLMYRNVGGPTITSASGLSGETEMIPQKVEPATGASWITASASASYNSLQELIEELHIEQYWDLSSSDTQLIDARYGASYIPYTTAYMPSVIYSFNYGVADPVPTEGTEPQSNATGVKNTFHIQTANVPFNKIDEEGNRLGGATLQLFDTSDNSKVDEWTTSASEAHVLTLEQGTYRLHEAATPNGYVTADDITFTVTPIGEIKIGAVNVTAINMTDADTEVTLKKTDITTGQRVPGAKMAIYLASDVANNAPKPGTTAVCTWTTAADQDMVLEHILLENTDYVLFETEAPAGYVVAAPMAFHVNGDGVIQTIEMKEDYIKVKIEKKDDLDRFVQGAVLQILSEDGQTVIKEWTSDNAAKVFDRLPAGNYILHEVSAPTTHHRACDIPFTVQSTSTVQVFRMEDRIKAQMPTGVFLKTWKYLPMIGSALLLAIFILIGRRKRDED